MTTTDVAPIDPPAQTVAPSGGGVRWLVAAGLVVLLGVPAGFAWSALTPRLHFLVTVGGPFPVTEDVAGQIVDADGWFAVIAVVLGVCAGVVGVMALRRVGPAAPAVAAGTAVVAVFVTFVVGQLAANHRILWSWNPTAGDNHEVVGPLVLHAWGVTVIAPIAAAFVVLVASIFVERPSTDR